MKPALTASQLLDFIETKSKAEILDFCTTTHPVEAAEIISALPAEEAWEILKHLSPSLQAEIFSHLWDGLQIGLSSIMGKGDFARVLSEMSPDDRVTLYKKIPPEQQEGVFPALAQAEREDIRRLSKHEEGTAGAAMTSDYAALAPGLTAAQSIERLRMVAPDKETIYYAYVVDEQRKLLGFVSLKDLILARREARLSDIMHSDVIYARVDEDQEVAARKIQKYDLIALPVVDGNDALMGIITHDDAMDIITQEHTEDMEKFMAIAGSHESTSYLHTSAVDHFKKRAVWVMALAALGLVSGYVVQSFENMLVQFAILASFMPMLADTGGNTGSQSATLVVRALALGEIRSKDTLKIVAKEFAVAMPLAIMLGVVAFGRVFLFDNGTLLPNNISALLLASAVAIALGLQVVTATIIGAVLPLLAAGLKLDPAVVASPALTTVVDVTGLLIYFSTVKFLLGI